MRQQRVAKLAQALQSWQESVALVGECIIQFQRIEEMLSICISAMIGQSRRVGEIVTTEMSFRARVATFGALFMHSMRVEHLPEGVDELIKRLQWAEQKRNTLVHSLWDASESEPETVLRSKKALRKSRFINAVEAFTPRDLDELTHLFEGVVTDLVFLTSNHLPKLTAKLR